MGYTRCEDEVSEGMVKHTSKKLWKRRFVYFGRDRKRGDEPIPRYKERILNAQTTPDGSECWYAQDLNPALPRKHTHHIALTHEYVALAQIGGTGRLNIEVDRLHK
jgi:hypothetical protein